MNSVLKSVQKRRLKELLDGRLYLDSEISELTKWISCSTTDMATYYTPDKRSVMGEPPLYQINTTGYKDCVKLIIYKVINTCYVKLREWPVPKECEFFADGKVINMKTLRDHKLPPWSSLAPVTEDSLSRLSRVSLNGSAPIKEVAYTKGRFDRTSLLMSLIIQRDKPEIVIERG